MLQRMDYMCLPADSNIEVWKLNILKLDGPVQIGWMVSPVLKNRPGLPVGRFGTSCYHFIPTECEWAQTVDCGIILSTIQYSLSISTIRLFFPNLQGSNHSTIAAMLYVVQVSAIARCRSIRFCFCFRSLERVEACSNVIIP